jgi:hypothetical protein
MHGMWKGDNFTQRLTYDMTDPAIDWLTVAP